MWAAWWTAAPEREPFRKPDAFSGGARSREEALARAEKAAGTALVEIDSRWVRAAHRVQLGQSPWLKTSDEGAPHAGLPRAAVLAERQAPRQSIWQRLGIEANAELVEIKRAYKRRALETHPDRGGNAAEFQDVQRAYEEAVRRRARDARRPKPKPFRPGK